MNSPNPPTASPPAAGLAARADRPVSRLTAAVGLCGAALVMILSLSAFVVGSHDGRLVGPEIGRYAADFSLRDAADRRVSLSQFEGRPLVLLFTDGEARDLRLNLAAAAGAVSSCGGQPEVLIVHDDLGAAAGAGECESYLQEHLARPVVSLLDAGDAVAERYGVVRRPAAVVVSPAGVILDRGPLAAALGRLPRTLAAAR